MALILFAALIGVLFFLPLSAISWVRARGAWVLGCVFGKARVSAPERAEPVSGDAGAIAHQFSPANELIAEAEVSPPPPNKPIKWGRAVSNIANFFAGCVAFFAKHPVLCIGLILLGAYLVFGLPFGLGKSKADLRADLREARAESAARKAEAGLAEYAGRRGDETQARERRIERAVEAGQREIADAVSQTDFDVLWGVYAERYLSLYDRADARDAHPPAERPSGVRVPNSHAA